MADFFPQNRDEALTMLYLQSQDLSGKTPEEIAAMYVEVKKRIHIALLSLK